MSLARQRCANAFTRSVGNVIVTSSVCLHLSDRVYMVTIDPVPIILLAPSPVCGFQRSFCSERNGHDNPTTGGPPWLRVWASVGWSSVIEVILMLPKEHHDDPVTVFRILPFIGSAPSSNLSSNLKVEGEEPANGALYERHKRRTRG